MFRDVVYASAKNRLLIAKRLDKQLRCYLKDADIRIVNAKARHMLMLRMKMLALQ